MNDTTSVPIDRWRELDRGGTGNSTAVTYLPSILDIGPIISFELVPLLDDQIMAVQAYPVGTGDTVSDIVEWLLNNGAGHIRFGIADMSHSARLSAVGIEKRLVVQFSEANDEIRTVLQFANRVMRISATSSAPPTE